MDISRLDMQDYVRLLKMALNYKHLATNLAIATDGFPTEEVVNILEWLEEKKMLTVEGLQLKRVFEEQESKEENQGSD